MPEFSVADTILDFSEPLTVNRVSGDVNSDGFVTPATTPVSNVVGCIQPMGNKELRNLPEGQRHLEWWSIWSTTELKVGDRVAGTLTTTPTVVVQGVTPWGTLAGFWIARASKVTDNTAL